MAVVSLGVLGTASTKTAGTTLDVTNTSGAVIPAGTTLHFVMVCDNPASTSSPQLTILPTSTGNPLALYHSGSIGSGQTTTAGSGVWHRCITTTTALPIAAGAVITTMSTTVSVAARAISVTGFTGVVFSPLRGTVATNGSATGSPSVASGGTAPVTGDLVIGCASFENNAQMTGDTDTLNGTWSSMVGTFTTGGGAATNVGVGTQYKVVTADGAQTYNPTGGVGDTVGCIIALTPTAPPAITQAAYQWYDEGTESGAVPLANQDTAVVGDIANGDATGTLRIRLQETGSGNVPTTDDWQLQWEKNGDGTWTQVGGLGLIDTYDETNYTSSVVIGETSGTNDIQGQSFLGTGTPLLRAGLWLAKTSSPAGTISASLFAHTGTFGSTGTGTGAALATSTTSINSASLGTDPAFTWQYFDFDGTLTLAAGTPYVLAIINPSLGVFPNVARWGMDNTSPTHPGNRSARTRTGGTWGQGTEDLIFRVYGPGGTATTYDSPNLTNGGATTNRLTGGTGTFVPGKVSEDAVMDDLGWATGNYTELVYAMKIKAGDVVAGDTLRFRVLRNGSTATMTYTQTPVINVIKSAATPVGTGSGVYDWSRTVATGYKEPKATTTAGVYDWSRTAATGKRTPKATAATGVYDWSRTAAVGDTPPNRGSSTTGVYAWDGTAATGKRTPKATSTAGTYDWSRTTVTGKRTPKGTASAGTYDWSRTAATGDTPPNRGSSTAGTYDWTGTAVGLKPAIAPKVGTAAGTYDWTRTAATGKRTPKGNATAGGYLWALTAATGDTPPNRGSSTTGAYDWAGTAVGFRPIIPAKVGTAAGAYDWSRTAATGKRTPKATSPSGTYNWSGVAQGLAPIVGQKVGTAIGAYLWARTTVTGTTVPRGTATAGGYAYDRTAAAGTKAPRGTSPAGTYTWARTTATGTKAPSGAGVAGTYLWARTAATGQRTPKGAATGGGYNWSGTGTGTALPKATSTTGGYNWSGTGQGVRPLPGVKQGTAAGTYTWARTAATGLSPVIPAKVGTATGGYAYDRTTAAGYVVRRATGTGGYLWARTTATGTTTPRGTSPAGTYRWTGNAQGLAPAVGTKAGTAMGAYTWARTTAAGQRASRSPAAGAYLYTGTATGKRPRNQTAYIADFYGRTLHVWQDGTRYPVQIMEGASP